MDLSHLPRHGTIPIPFTTPLRDGRPVFRQTDPDKHNLCLRFQLCGVCGKYIERPPYVFAIAPLCFQERLVFATPMHPDGCAQFAFRTCPYLTRERWERFDGPREGTEIVGREELPPKPSRPGLAFVQRYSAVPHLLDPRLLIAKLPEQVERVQWWHYVDGVLQPEPGVCECAAPCVIDGCCILCTFPPPAEGAP